MTRRKTEIDPTAQGSMLAPSPASLDTGQMVEVEGGYYRAPRAPTPQPTPEQQALKAEDTAISFLDKACVSKRNITNMERHQRELKKGNVRPDTDIPTELARLARRDEKGKPVGVIPTAQEHYGHFRRQAKIAYGESIGVETVVEPESRLVDGAPQEVLMVRARDPQRQAEFVEGFREFDSIYGQPGQAEARAQRHQEIEALL